MNKSKKDHIDFYQEYWLTTFEGVIVALVVATVALIGLYWTLIIPVFIQLILIWLLVSYKRLKRQTEIAIETNINARQSINPKSRDELFDEAKKDFYTQNKIRQKLRAYHYCVRILLIFSIAGVGYLPFIEEMEKKNANHKSIENIYIKMDSINTKLDFLKNHLENKGDNQQKLNARIESLKDLEKINK